jgi:hypothetical protein
MDYTANKKTTSIAEVVLKNYHYYLHSGIVNALNSLCNKKNLTWSPQQAYSALQTFPD